MMKSKAGVSYQAACASWTKLGASLGSASDRHRAEAGWNTIECVAPLASRSRRREQLGSHGRIGQRRISGRAGTRTRPDVHPVQVVAEYGSVGPCRRLDRCQQQENRGGSPGQQLGHLVHLSRRGALSRGDGGARDLQEQYGPESCKLTWFASIHKKLRQGSPCNGRISRIQTDGAGRSTPAACQAESLTAGGGMQPIRRPRRHRPPSPAGPGPPGGGVAPAGAAVRAAPDRQPRARRRCGSHGRRSGNSTGAAARPWPPPRLPAWPLRGGAPPRESCFHGRRRCTSPTTRGRSTARQGRKAYVDGPPSQPSQRIFFALLPDIRLGFPCFMT